VYDIGENRLFWVLAVLLADDLTEQDEEQDADPCSVLIVSLKTAMEKNRYDVQNILDARTQCAGVEE
jgi:cell division protein ZapA (FtsZ GTPase activity inhibitor)